MRVPTGGPSAPTGATHVVDLNSTVQLQMIRVEPGTFTMGSPITEIGRQQGETEHNVTLTKPFYLGKYEVTQAQYEAVMTGNANGLSATPSQYSGNPNRPVETVSWNGVQVFLARLNAAEQAARAFTCRLVLCLAHRSPMGICLPGGNDHRLLLG